MIETNYPKKFLKMPQALEILRKSRLFDQLTNSDLSKLSPRLAVQHFPESCDLTREAENNDQVYFLIRGVISIYSEGELVMRLKRLGDMCGDFKLVTSKASIANEVASTPVEVLSMDVGAEDKSESEEVDHLLFKLFSVMMLDKLALTTNRAHETGRVEKELTWSKRQLLGALDDAEKMCQIRSYFLQHLRQDLRPLTHGIIGITDLLLNSDLSPQQRSYAEMVMASAESLMNIVNSLHVFTRHNSDGVVLNQGVFTPETLIKQVVGKYQSSCAKKNISLFYTIASDVPVTLVGDPHRATVILSHLVENAIKYTKHGQVTVSLMAESGDLSQVELRFLVEDTGIGINEEAKDCVFEPFTQADTNLTRECSGVGLGLAICDRLVAKMGGRIGFDSRENEGSVFWCILPFRKVTGTSKNGFDWVREHRPFTLNRCDMPEKPSVLVIDNDPVEQLVMTRVLRRIGYQAISVDSGEKALRLTRVLQFDLIIVNLELSRSGAYPLVKKLKDNRHYNEEKSFGPSVYALTASYLDFDFGRFVEAGFDGLIERPVTLDNLRHILGEWQTNRSTKTLRGIPSLMPKGKRDSAELKKALNALEEKTGNLRLPIDMFLREYPIKRHCLDQALQGKNGALIVSAIQELKNHWLILGLQEPVLLLDQVEEKVTGSIAEEIDDLLIMLDNWYESLLGLNLTSSHLRN